jgi:hypothetical protein
MGEIRQIYKEKLFLWIKNSILTNSNGFFCIKQNQVINAGAQHLKDANMLAGIAPSIGEGQANPDR